ncbi:zinc finger protein 808-like [Cloeon dipterum]|uniref:zinc finger protein 808-like n=1 Tax=Cloeon dipterum TaxID=197152 RepID=UPI00321F7E7F
MQEIVSPPNDEGDSTEANLSINSKNLKSPDAKSENLENNESEARPTLLKRPSDMHADDLADWQVKLARLSNILEPQESAAAKAGPSNVSMNIKVRQDKCCTYCGYRGSLNIHSISKYCPECDTCYSCINFFRIHRKPECRYLMRWKATGDYPPILDRVFNEWFQRPLFPKKRRRLTRKKGKGSSPKKKDKRVLSEKKAAPKTLTCDACGLKVPENKRRALTLHLLSATHCRKTLEILPCEISQQMHREGCAWCASPKKKSTKRTTVCGHCNEAVPKMEFVSHQVTRQCFKCKETNWFKCRNLLEWHLQKGHLSEEKAKTEIPPQSSDKEYGCPGCDRKFKDRKTLDNHKRDICVLCQAPVACAAQMMQHCQDMHLICMYCSQLCDSKALLAQHQTNYRCDDCNKLFKCDMSLEQHCERAHASNECSCGTVLASKTALEAHKIAMCLVCEAQFSCVSILRRHQANNPNCSIALQYNDASEEEEEEEEVAAAFEFACKHCSSVVDSAVELKRHQSKQQCDACRLVLGCEQQLSQHRTICKVCDLCKQRAVHLRTHQKTVTCENCKEQLGCDGLWTMHRFQCLDGMRSKTCTHCKLKFTDSMAFIKHTCNTTCPKCQISEKCATLFAKHTCEDTLPTTNWMLRCKYCHGYYTTMKALEKHKQETHCDNCGISQPCATQLRDHKIHCTVRSVRCPICKQQFLSATQLGMHVEKQHSVKECQHCGKAYDSVQRLLSHVARWHSVDTSTSHDDYAVKQSTGCRLILVRRTSSQDTPSPRSVVDEESTSVAAVPEPEPAEVLTVCEIKKERAPDLPNQKLVDLTADDEDSDLEVIKVVNK